MSTDTRAQNVAAALSDFMFEFGNTLGLWRGRLALTANPKFITDAHVRQAAWFRHEFEVKAGADGTPEQLVVKLHFQASPATAGSFILNGPDDVLEVIAAWAAKTQPRYDQVCLGGNELQFWIRLDDEDDARNTLARIPMPKPVICVFPGMPPANA